MKLDLKKELQYLYSVPKTPSVVMVPTLKVVSVMGEGNPNNSKEFQEAIELLYGTSYTLKFICKKQGSDFAVMPMEGLWWMDNMNEFTVQNKDKWKWKIFIVQPNFVTKGQFTQTIELLAKRKPEMNTNNVVFEEFNEGKAAQVLYIGPYADETETIKNLHSFIKENGGELSGLHHEIYLSDMRRTAPEKLKTIIRQPFI